MKTITLKCTYCGKDFEKYSGEVKRQLKRGKTNFFCNLSCLGFYKGAIRPDKKVEVEKICLYCKKPFKTMTGCKSPVYCSRGCASAGSMSEERRGAQRQSGVLHHEHLLSVVETMKRREHWKYVKVAKFLDLMEENFEFEFPLENYIYDLFLKNRKTLIEFDSIHHNQDLQKENDRIKNEVAFKNGYDIIRIRTPINSIIEPELIYEIVKPNRDICQR